MKTQHIKTRQIGSRKDRMGRVMGHLWGVNMGRYGQFIASKVCRKSKED